MENTQDKKHEVRESDLLPGYWMVDGTHVKDREWAERIAAQRNVEETDND